MTGLTIIGDPTSLDSLPRLAAEVGEAMGRWATVAIQPSVPSSGQVFVAIADRNERAQAMRQIDQERLATLIHPTAAVSASANLGRNVMISAQAVVMMDALVGDGTVANALTSIEHDNRIGALTFLGTGAVLCGGVTTGEFAFIGGGAVVKPGVTIGARCTVGTGAVVIHDTTASSTVVGNPARSL